MKKRPHAIAAWDGFNNNSEEDGDGDDGDGDGGRRCPFNNNKRPTTTRRKEDDKNGSTGKVVALLRRNNGDNDSVTVSNNANGTHRQQPSLPMTTLADDVVVVPLLTTTATTRKNNLVLKNAHLQKTKGDYYEETDEAQHEEARPPALCSTICSTCSSSSSSRSSSKLDLKDTTTSSEENNADDDNSPSDHHDHKAAAADLRTGLVFECGEKHYDVRNRFHKERPSRIAWIRQALEQSNDHLFARCTILNETNDDDDDAIVNEQQSSMSDINKLLQDEDFHKVHLPAYLQRLDASSTCPCRRRRRRMARPPTAAPTTMTDMNKKQLDDDDDCCQGRLDREADQYTSIYLTRDSLDEAKRAASSLWQLVKAVLLDKKEQHPTLQLDNGFAVIRPPGHHAAPSLAGGFCLLNNVALAAKMACNHGNRRRGRRVLIVDWDIHHGNGTQSIFLDDPNVLYFSVHRWHGGNFFPFKSNGCGGDDDGGGGPRTLGTGNGKGYNVNVGWSQNGMGDEEYYAVWDILLIPMIREFQPDLILVSCGFDGAQGDAVGECNITPTCFGNLTRALLRVPSAGTSPTHNEMNQSPQAPIPVVCALEGGYVRSVIQRCAKAVVAALLERPPQATKPKLITMNEIRNPPSPGDAAKLETATTTTIPMNDAFPLATVRVDTTLSKTQFSRRTVADVLKSIHPMAAKDIRATMEAHRPYWKFLNVPSNK